MADLDPQTPRERSAVWCVINVGVMVGGMMAAFMPWQTVAGAGLVAAAWMFCVFWGADDAEG